MQQLIDDMKAIPGVIGACTYRSQEGITNNNLPSLFSDERLHNSAKHLAKIHAAGRLNFPDMTEVMVNYEESVVVFRQINLNDHLIAFCDPGINMNLLGMSLNLAIENLSVQAVGNINKAVPKPATKPPNVKALLEKGPMAQPLQSMQKLLTKVIGPMAKIVFEEALIRWVSTIEDKKGSFSKLLEIVCQEIGDGDKSTEYRNLVREKMASRSQSRKSNS